MAKNIVVNNIELLHTTTISEKGFENILLSGFSTFIENNEQTLAVFVKKPKVLLLLKKERSENTEEIILTVYKAINDVNSLEQVKEILKTENKNKEIKILMNTGFLTRLIE